MATVTKPVALDESINTTENTPRNIADVLADELSNIADKIQGGGGSGGGHVIQNSQGANLTQRGTMQFVDAHLTDDSTNEKTVIENIKSATESQFESATEDGLYDVDVEGAEIGEISEDYVEVTADGVKTWQQLLNELYALIDSDKINNNSYIKTGTQYLKYQRILSNKYLFTMIYQYNAYAEIINGLQVASSESMNVEWTFYESNPIQKNDYTSSKPTSGTKITLYYGNDKAVVDLQTTANRCLMSDGETVEDAMYKAKLLASSSASGTHSSKLQTLWSVYDALSLEKKLKTFVTDGNQVFYLQGIINGYFVFSRVFNSSISLNNIGLQYGTYYSFNGTQYYDLSNTTDTTVFKLYIQ